MNLIEFKDSCIVLRDNGKRDEWGNPLMEKIYSGKCHYQQGVQAYSEIAQRNSVLFIEGIHCLNDNDAVQIKVALSGRKCRGIIKTTREIELPITHEKITRVEVIQDTEKGGRQWQDHAKD